MATESASADTSSAITAIGPSAPARFSAPASARASSRGYEASRLSWKTWCDVCAIVPGREIEKGDYDGSPSDKCGESHPFIKLLLRRGPRRIASHGDWLVVIAGEVFALKPAEFEMLRRLRITGAE